MRFLLLSAVAVLVLSAYAFAAVPVDPGPEPGPYPGAEDGMPDVVSLATLGGILAATALLVQVTKRGAANIAGLQKIPLGVYGFGYAAVLTGLSYAADLQEPAGPGSWGWIAGAVQSGIAALAATGAYEYFTGKATSATPARYSAAYRPADTPYRGGGPGPGSRYALAALLILPAALLGGCTSDPEFASFRNSTRGDVEWLAEDSALLYRDAVRTGLRTPTEQATAALRWEELRGAYADYDNPGTTPPGPVTPPPIPE
jgi:hypothetical protein